MLTLFLGSFNLKDTKVTFIILFLIDLFKHSMRSISLLLIWVVQVSFSLVKTMQTSCTNSCTINLNVLEEQRKLNERYGEDWNQIPEHNKNETKIFYSLDLLACIQNTIN